VPKPSGVGFKRKDKFGVNYGKTNIPKISMPKILLE
jgi:hypothetical protein